MIRVKICGTCGAADRDAAVAAGADAIGVVTEFPDPVPWNLDRDTAAKLVDGVPPFVTSVAVTTGDPADVADLAATIRPDVIQMHGEKPPDVVAGVVDRLGEQGVQTIKAVTVDPAGDLDRQRERVAAVVGAGVDGVVIDTAVPDRRGGGSGQALPWDRARRLTADLDLPVVLAGGLTPENVADAVAAVDPDGVDVISGVERERCEKDPDRMAAFVDTARRAGREHRATRGPASRE
ncbi:MAG: phosphoribosylanthranilate isomerase [Halobacteriaceae archaeon]